MAWTDIDYMGCAAEKCQRLVNTVREDMFSAADALDDAAYETAMIAVGRLEGDILDPLHAIEAHGAQGDWEKACEAAEALRTRIGKDGASGDFDDLLDPGMRMTLDLELETGILNERRNNEPDASPAGLPSL